MLQDFLSRLRPEGEAQHRFQAWPPAPAVREAGWSKPLPAFGRPEPRRSARYAPAIVIGLGTTGDRVLRQWLGQVASTAVGQPVLLRAGSLTARAAAGPWPAGPVPSRQFFLSPASVGGTGPFGNRRGAVRSLFREYANCTPFRDWAHVCISDLHHDIQVVVAASVAEPEIGVLGEVLQVLHQTMEGPGTPFLRIVALLTTETPEPARAIDPAETYAALREIARFAVNGPHWVEPHPGVQSGLVRTALLDHLFLIGARGPAPNGLDLSKTPFDEGVGQAMAEAIFTLLHPSANLRWENLRTREPLVHSLGIAALRVPTSELQEYVAARLAQAALYGEHPHHPSEGLVFRNQTRVAPDAEDDDLARRWLVRGACAHPLFQWLLNEVSGPASFKSTPSLKPEFEAVFQAQLAHGLTSLLNSPPDADSLGQARAALNWLAKWIGQLDGWLKAVPDATPGVSERMDLRDLFGRWQGTVAHLKQQINAWESALFEPERTPAPAETAAPASKPSLADWRTTGTGQADAASVGLSAEWRPSSPPITANWRAPAAPQPGVPASPPAAVAPGTLSGTLRQYRRTAEASLIAAAGGQISRALTADAAPLSELGEVEAYYADTVRPELKQFGLGNSQAFTRVRDRLGWWVSLSPGRQPELFLVCIPPELAVESPESAPPPEARSTSLEIDRLGQAVLSVARAQTQGLAADLTGPWFQQRLDQMAGFLRRAAHPLLNYDQNAAAERPHGVARHAYLIARDQMLAGRHRAAFPDLPLHAVNELGDGEETRFTALSLWLNIPLATVVSLREAYGRYRHQAALHLYPQERTAALYETQAHAQNGEWTLLPPDFVSALADPRLVTLFYQSLIGGLIELRLDASGQPRRWTLLSLGAAFAPLPLAAEGPLDLWQALRRFALELPNDRAVDQNPANHFHRDRRAQFLETLTAAIRERRHQPEFNARRDEIRRTLLAEWQRRGRDDHLARAFARLLAVELEGPAWPGW